MWKDKISKPRATLRHGSQSNSSMSSAQDRSCSTTAPHAPTRGPEHHSVSPNGQTLEKGLQAAGSHLIKATAQIPAGGTTHSHSSD